MEDMATAKKTTPSPEVLAASRDLLRAIKLARDLPDLERALRALPGAGDAGVHAMTELKPQHLPLRKGAQPHEDAIAWTSTEMLAAGEGGLCDPHVLPRPVEAPKAPPERKAKDQEVPASGVRVKDPEPTEREKEMQAWMDSLPTPTREEMRAAPPIPEGHDPEEAAAAIRSALERQRIEVREVVVKPGPTSVQVKLALVVNGKVERSPVNVPWRHWGQPLRDVANGLAESLAAAVGE